MKIYGMSGKMGSGKDFIARLISDNLKNENKDISISYMAFADVLRAEIMEINDMLDNSNESMSSIAEKIGVTRKELEGLQIMILVSYVEDGFFDVYKRSDNSRRALQYWGTDVRRKQDNDYWTKLLVKKARELESTMSDSDVLFITDARFPNEVEAVKQLGGKTIRVTAPVDIRVERLKARGNFSDKGVLNHLSEIALDSVDDFDIIINSLTELSALKQLKAFGVINSLPEAHI